MAVAASVKRYAQAVFQVALEQDTLEAWLSDLDVLAQVSQEPDLMLLMESPRVPLRQKEGLLRQRLGGLQLLALNLALLLVAKGRLDRAEHLAVEFRRLTDAYRGIEHAQVTTAVPLAAEERRALVQRLAQLTGKEIVLEERVEPEILGGLVARIGDRLLDGSVRGKLLALRRHLAGVGS